jgi:GNAT superfamily N-acetyltransferase
MITIDTLSGSEATGHRDEVLRIWSSAFGTVEDPDEWAASPWDRHRTRPGYRLVLARAGEEALGFAWGYTGERGQYWSDAIVREVGPRIEGWVGGHFEFVELAVLPEARGRGVGGRLHDALLAGLPHERALLATSDAPDDPAVRLYLSRGWRRLAAHGDGRQIMGLSLPVSEPRKFP